jgi:hypothetical protein
MEAGRRIADKTPHHGPSQLNTAVALVKCSQRGAPVIANVLGSPPAGGLGLAPPQRVTAILPQHR